MASSKDAYSDLLAGFLVSKHRSELEEAIGNGGGFLSLSVVEMAEFDIRIFNKFIASGREFMQTLKAVVYNIVADALLNSKADFPQCHVTCRIIELPSCPEICLIKAPRSRDIGKLIQFTGIVVGMSQATIINFQRTFSCNKCHHVFVQEVDILDKTFSCKPTHCPSPAPCAGRGFTEQKSDGDGTKQRLRNFQELVVQELAPGDAHIGAAGEASRSMPSSVTVLLMDDLIDSCKPGDWIATIGLVENRWKSMFRLSPLSESETVIVASSVAVLSSSVDHTLPCDMETEDDEFRFFWTLGVERQLASRDQIVASICPRLYGLYPLKLAIALMLLSGSSSPQSTSKAVSKRSEIHVLLVGDPGTGKSQLLSFAKKLARRSVLTTGVGTSAAGLTVAAVQTATGWSLEPGALLLADRGLCCIDEFSRMRAHDKTVVHEALEQQTVSVAKAGIVCRLPCRTAVLAATNARGSYDIDIPLTVNTSLSAPLLSRFDLIFILRDSKNREWDSEVADHILTFGALQLEDSDSIWSVPRLRSYLAYCSRFSPKLSSAASRLITQYYVHRRNDNDDIDAEGRTTTRLLDSLARLTQAHAKLMCRGAEANLVDAIQAVVLMEISRMSSTRWSKDILFQLGQNANASLLTFPDDPDTFLLQRGEALLSALDLQDLLDQLRRECYDRRSVDLGDDVGDGDLPLTTLCDNAAFADTEREMAVGSTDIQDQNDGAKDEDDDFGDLITLSFASFCKSSQDRSRPSSQEGPVVNEQSAFPTLKRVITSTQMPVLTTEVPAPSVENYARKRSLEQVTCSSQASSNLAAVHISDGKEQTKTVPSETREKASRLSKFVFKKFNN